MKITAYTLTLIPLLLAPAAQAAYEITGRISAIDPGNHSIEISGVTVVSRQKMSVEKLFAVGDRVEVEGRYTGPAEMLAHEFEKISPHGTDVVEGTIESMDGAAWTLTISGITIRLPGGVKLAREGAEDITLGKPTRKGVKFGRYFRQGERIECRGRWSAPREFTALLVDFD